MEYLSYNRWMKEKHGEKVYKLSLSVPCSCPNRDGSKGTGGCIFCSGDGSGTFAQQPCLPIPEQIRRAKSLVAAKGAKKFVAYFQSFTSTYGDLSVIGPMLLEAATSPDVVEVSIATRPDCLGEAVMALLRRVGTLRPLTVELGLQTIHGASAEKIHRCYPLSTYDEAVKKLHRLGAHVVTHLILGFPWETRQEMIESAAYVGRSGADGIKLQLLHVLKDTALCRMYEQEPFPLPSMEEYISLVGECLLRLPPDMVIHRLTGDGAKKDLVAPLWSGDKKRVMNAMQRHIAAL